MPERVGQQLGNYTLLQLLGQGGFADVYLGEHIYLKSQAAIKVLQTRLSDSSDIDSFLREAQTIARLSHPNIIRVLDFGMAQDTPYLVMDYAPNGTLRARHPRGSRVPLATLQPYVSQLAAALQHAHDEHVIHRDIKPENMLLGRRNEVLLSDFGIALIAQTSRSQATQDVIGTVSYMSPEQIQGKPRPASDQYSLAVVIYEWLSGDRPFHGSFTELCTQHMFAAPPHLSTQLLRFSPTLDAVIMRALEKDPKQRYESIQLFAQAFHEASQHMLQSAQGTQAFSDSEAARRSQQAQSEQQRSQSYSTIFQPDRPALSQPSSPTAEPVLPTNKGEQPSAASPTGATFHSSETVARTRAEEPSTLPQTQPATPLPPQPSGAHTPYAQPANKIILPAQPAQPPRPPSSAQPPTPRGTRQQAAPAQGPQAYSENQRIYNPAHYPAQGAPEAASYPSQPLPPMTQQASHMSASSSRSNAFESLEREAQQRRYPPAQPAPQVQSQQRQRETAATATETTSANDEELWNFLGKAKWKILAGVIGIVLVCIVHNIHPLLPLLLNRQISIILIVPLFFGAAFGPWVGLSVGIGGLLAEDLLFAGEDNLRVLLFRGVFYPAHQALYTWWMPFLLYALAGFIPGLTMLRKRKYPGIGSAMRAMLLAAIVFACALGFILYQVNTLRALPTIGLILLVNLAVTLLLLIVYSVVIRLIDPGQ